jgi:hypothetical protein
MNDSYDNFFKYKDPVSGFITKPQSAFNRTFTENSPDSTLRWETTRERLGPDWIWYDEDNRVIEYTFDKYGFRNWNNPDELEDDNYILLTGQSQFEGTGLPIEDTIPYLVEQETGIKCYQVSTTGIDAQAIYYNTMNALQVLPRPKHIVNMPTDPGSKVMTFEIESGTYFNCFDWFGKNREHICNAYGIEEDYLRQCVDMVDTSFNSGYSLRQYLEYNSLIDRQPIPSTIIAFCCEPEMGSLFDKITVEPQTHGNDRFFDGPNRIRMPLFPLSISDDFIKLMRINHLEDYDNIPIEWINTRARDCIHTGQQNNRKLAKEIAKNI